MTVRPIARKIRIDLQRSIWPGVRITLAGVAFFAAVFGLRAGVLPYVASHPYFALQFVRVTSDVPQISPGYLAGTAGLWAGRTLWQVDADSAEAALARLDWVGKAEVELQLPDTAVVRVQRKEAVAATVVEGESWEIAADGTLFRVPGEGGPFDLPYLTGWYDAEDSVARRSSLRRLLGILAEAESREFEISQIDIGEEDQYQLFLDTSQVAISLGVRPEPVAVVGRLARALDHLGENLAYASALDVSSPDGRTIARARDAAALDVLAPPTAASVDGGFAREAARG